jgi:hypothetical protein
VAAQVQNLICVRRETGSRANGLNHPVPHEQTAVGDLPPLTVHGDQDAGVAD